jgi:uncharacterized protein (DUF58 family)
VTPASFPAACDLEWRVRPYALTTAPEEEAAFFRGILGFWFGDDSLPSLDSLTGGLSNVYGRDSVEHAVVAVSLRFRSPEAAAAAAAQVAKLHAAEPRRWCDREGSLLLMLSAQPDVPEQSARYLRDEVRRRSRAAA